ncbi:hypothetical protein Bca4012_074375 [Brassica carinata]|uniref:Uncharacterized protein n=2 Tax=Brassica TaxID=3705 RepID=A0A3P6FHH7_BRAOL|nr:unnamed protein product [Brassica napus]CDY23606.1 BnaC05g39880D [Brassica napus]VDD46561.1 unnamed protein product [Brassica oleracea]
MDAFERKNRSHGVNATSELNTKRATHTQFVELKYMNRHKLKGTLRAKQKVSIRCIMCGDMRLVAKVVVVG